MADLGGLRRRADLVGVFREPEFSPGRVDDDAAILEHTAEALAERGVRMQLGTVDTLRETTPRAVLAMCQSDASLTALDPHAPSVPVINTPNAIRNCHRVTTIERLRDTSVPFPATRIVATRGGPAHGEAAPCWIKRGDVHAMEPGDVTFAGDAETVAATLEAFAARGIARAALQAHVPGIVLKFYGVGNTFFRCYTDEAEPPTAIEALWHAARAGATRLGLEVWGGDVVVTPEGNAVLIDINDWPSFARCRTEAADAIASHVCDRLGITGDEVRAGA